MTAPPEIAARDADRTARLVAVAIDRALPAFVGVGAAVLAAAVATALEIVAPGALDRSPPWVALAGGAAFLAIHLLNLVLLAQEGQSLGKRWMGIRVVGTDGAPPDVASIVLVRTLLPLAAGTCSSLFTALDALPIFGADRRCIHDRMADTRVIEVDD